MILCWGRRGGLLVSLLEVGEIGIGDINTDDSRDSRGNGQSLGRMLTGSSLGGSGGRVGGAGRHLTAGRSLERSADGSDGGGGDGGGSHDCWLWVELKRGRWERVRRNLEWSC